LFHDIDLIAEWDTVDWSILIGSDNPNLGIVLSALFGASTVQRTGIQSSHDI
jgi:hypothetical protein